MKKLLLAYAKKSAALIMAVMMLMTCWVWIAPVEADAAMVLNTHRKADKYGTPYWDGSDVYYSTWNSGGSYTTIKWAKHIYLDVSETLQSAGYYYDVKWSYGSNTDYRIVNNGFIFGGWKLQNTSNWTDTTKLKIMDTLFTGYDLDASLPNGDSDATQATDYSNTSHDLYVGLSNWDGANTIILRTRKDGENSAYVFMKGTPKAAATGRYSTSGGKPTSFGGWQSWGCDAWNNASDKYTTSNDSSNWTTDCYEGTWKEVAFDITIYDKSALNTAIDENTVTDKAPYTDASWSTYQTALNKARTVLTTRATTQTEIDNARTGLITAKNNLVKKTFTITWKDGNGDTLKTDTVTYGNTPSYTGATPTKTATAEYTYTFNNTWSPAITAATANETYTAQFTETKNKYTVTWNNHDGSHLETDTDQTYGTTPTYNGATPTQAADATHHYTFKGWDPTVSSVTGNITYKATFDSVAHVYDKQVATDTYKNTDATCTRKATYFYSCTCGAKGTSTFEYGDFAAHKLDKKTGVDSTCTTPGTLEHWQCTVCYKYFEDAAGTIELPGRPSAPLAPHTFTTYVSNNDATCTENGTETAKCDYCDATDTRIDEDSKLPHDYNAVVTDPTCTEEGYITFTCKDCGDSYVGDKVAAKGHTEGTPVREKEVAATCYKKGSYDEVVYCSVCGEELSRTSKEIEMTAHTPSAAVKENVVDETCTTDGSYESVVYCSVDACKAEISRNKVTVPELGHNMIDATCSEPKSCTRCDYTEGEADPSKHVVVPATCIAFAYCSACNATLGNEYGDHTPDADATCITDSICTVCDDVLEEAFGHTFKEFAAVEETCNTIGNEAYKYCETCNKYFAADAGEYAEGGADTNESFIIPAHGHNFTEYEAKDTTCLAAGNRAYKYCETCKKYYEPDAHNTAAGGSDENIYIIPQLAHSYTGAIRNDGNSKDATHSFLCVNGCNEYGGTVKHTWNDGEDITKADCFNDGSKKYTCTADGCGATYTEVVPATGHVNVIATTAKDVSDICLADGNKAYWTCQDCGNIYTDEAYTEVVTDHNDANNNGIPDVLETKGPDHEFTGAYVSISDGVNGEHHRKCVRFEQCRTYGTKESHNFGDPDITEATCTATGKEVCTCSECSSSYTVTLEKIPHTIEKVEAVTPTCSMKGNNEYYKCSVCDSCFKDADATIPTKAEYESIPQLVHVWTEHHDYDTIVTHATCMAAAVYNNHCDYCGIKLSGTGTTHTYGTPDKDNGHKFDGEIQKNENGTHSYKCTIEGCPDYGNPTDCEYKVTADVASTCKTAGYTTYKCTICGNGYSDTKALDPNNHTGEGTKIVGQLDAKCNTNGYTGDTHCLGCDALLKKGETIDADPAVHPHENMMDYEGKASTCQDPGYSAYRYCDQCGTYEVEKKPGTLKAHSFTDYKPDGNGTHTATCDTCDPAVATPATDTKDCSGGTANCVDKKVCTVCKTAYGEVDSSNHKTPVFVAKVDSTCQVEGTEAYYKCTACNKNIDTPVKIEKKPHIYGTWSKIDGKDEHTRSCTTCKIEYGTIATETAPCSGGVANCVELAKCTDCKAEYGKVNPAVHKTEANHIEGAYSATCQAPGYTGDFYYDCCNALKQSGTAIAKLDHKYTIEVSRTPATCIAEGSVTYKCSTCVETVAEPATNTTVLPINPENHASTETKTVDYKAATCKDDGYTGDIYYTCCYSEEEGADNSKALKEKGRVIPADGTNHTSLKEFDAVPATCQKAGNYAYSYCSTCGTYMMNGENVTKDQTVEAKIAHTFTKYDSNDNGTHTATCDTCDEAIAAKATDTKNCSGGKANCTDFAECSTCGGAYGKLEPTIHKTAKTIAKLDPTCQKEGHEAYQHCDACGKDITTKKVINKLAHSFTEWTKVEDKDEHTRSCKTCDEDVAPVVTETEACKGGTATCKEKAECSVCGEKYGSLNLSNHISTESVFEDRVEATCQAEGNTGNEYYACCYSTEEGADNSKALKKAGEVIPKLNHKFDELVSGTKATCIAKGTETYKCSTCVETEEVKAETKTVELPIDKKNHASDEVKVIGKVDPTCATEGYTGDKYHACCYEINKTTSFIQKGYKLPATEEHTFINAVPEYLVEYTENEDGVITGYTAKEDTLTYEQKIAYRHSDNNWYHVQICEDCGKIIEGACYTYAHTSTCTTTDICEVCKGLCSLVNLKKHPGELTLIPAVPSTCDKQGTVAHYKCEACDELFFDAAGQKLVEDMDDLLTEETVEHSINTDVPAAPNTDPEKPGTHVFDCVDCDDPIVADCSGGEATCQNKAECSVCGQEYGEIDEENHESDEVVIVGEKAATCSEGGYTGDAYYKCCYVEGAEDNSKALKTMGSATPSEPSLHVEKLRNDGETHTVYCESCKEEFETVAHEWVAGEIPETASCTEGYDLAYTCECGATKTEAVPAKGHDYAESVTEKPANCTEAGSKTTVKTCKVCGDTATVTETIAALGHDERTIKGVAPTCSTEGSTDYIYCNRCDIIIQSSTKLPATGCEDANHDGFCDDCGTYLRTNEDGTNCNCICHKKNAFMQIIYKILNFFWKLFKIEKTCACGAVQHW